MSKDSVFVHLEAGEHMITDEAKRHKIALMLYCSILLSLSYFNKATIESIFGTLKFETPIPANDVLPLIFIVVIYYSVMYAHHYKEAIKAWKNKTHKDSISRNISRFNKVLSYTNNSQEQILNSDYLSNPIVEGDYSRRLFNVKSSIVQSLEDSKDMAKILEHGIPRFRPTDAEDFHEILEYLKTVEDYLMHVMKSRDANFLLYGKSTIDLKLSWLTTMKQKYEYGVLLLEKADDIENYYEQLQSLILDIEALYNEKISYFERKHFEKEVLLNNKIERCIKLKKSMVKEMKNLSVNERSNILLYRDIPTFYVLVTIFYASYKYLA